MVARCLATSGAKLSSHQTEEDQNVSSWCERFAHTTAHATSEAERLAVRIEDLQAAWLERLGEPRRDSAVRELVGLSPS